LLCHGTVCVVGKMRDLILQLSKSSIYSTKPFPWHDIGVKAGKALLELLNDKPGEKFIEIPSVLKVRASTAA
ncbi:hypothetical protein ABS828_24030, partial [Klebsiella pneumoniae]